MRQVSPNMIHVGDRIVYDPQKDWRKHLDLGTTKLELRVDDAMFHPADAVVRFNSYVFQDFDTGLTFAVKSKTLIEVIN